MQERRAWATVEIAGQLSGRHAERWIVCTVVVVIVVVYNYLQSWVVTTHVGDSRNLRGKISDRLCRNKKHQCIQRRENPVVRSSCQI